MEMMKSQMPEFKIIKIKGSTLNRQIKNSNDVAETFRELWEEGTIGVFESMFVLYLNRANRTVGWMTVSQGGMTGTVIDVRLVMKAGIDCLANSFILCHNHPSGSTEPSEQDIRITKNISEAGDILNIKLLDHLILTEDSYYSFADNGRL